MLISWLLIPGHYANGLEGRFQNSTYQNQCLCGWTSSPKWMQPVSYAARVSFSFLFHLQDTLQDQQVCLTQVPFKLLPLPCTAFKSHVSIFHSLLGLLKVSLTGLQSQMFWANLPGVDPQAESPKWGSDPLLLVESLCSFLIMHQKSRPCGMVLTIPQLCLSHLFHCGSFFISFIVECLYAFWSTVALQIVVFWCASERR